ARVCARDAERGRHFVVARIAVVSEHERQSIALGQRRDRGFELRRALLREQIAEHVAVVRLGRDALLALGAEQLRFLAATANDVDAAIACDGQDPTLEWPRAVIR